MNLNSKYFDCIRVKPDADRLRRERLPRCDWEGCKESGPHPAPCGRGREGQYFNFCLDHVRQYNKSYNYFAGMSDDEVASFQKDTVTGNRPTWGMGVNAWAKAAAASAAHLYGERRRPRNGFANGFGINDAFGLFGKLGGDRHVENDDNRRPIRNVERKCLRALGLDDTASAKQIKASYKALVKLHHPDRNGGDRRSEDKLRDVIQAYNYLRQVGLC